MNTKTVDNSNRNKKSETKDRDPIEKLHKKQVRQTQDDSAHNYDLDGVSMDKDGVRVATDEIH